MFISIIAFILILSVLVLVHEAGHYFVARFFDIKVEEFGFGFPPKVWGKKVGETLYSINLLPIGGFVKLFGEDDAGGGRITLPAKSKGHIVDSAKKDSTISHQPSAISLKRAFFSKPAWQRLLVVGAGVVMNFLLAVVILTYLYAIPGVPMPSNDVYVSAVAQNSPASQAGLVAGDKIVSVAGEKVVSPTQLISTTKMHLGQKIVLSFIDVHGMSQTISVTPRKVYPKGEGAMGIAIESKLINTRYSWYQAPLIGVRDSFSQSWSIVVGLGQTVQEIATTGRVPEGVAGPVGIARLTGAFVQSGVDATLSLLAMLSLNLAVLNILPIPALDGGRFFFILLEVVSGRKVNQKFESYAHTVGMVLLLALIVFITFHDILGIVMHTSVLP